MIELSKYKKIKNNLKFRIDDIKHMLIVEQEIRDEIILERKSRVIKNIIETTWRNEKNRNKRWKGKVDNDYDLELVRMIDRYLLIEIDLDLKDILSDMDYNIYRMLLDKCRQDYILSVYPMTRENLWHHKTKINKIIYDLLNR